MDTSGCFNENGRLAYARLYTSNLINWNGFRISEKHSNPTMDLVNRHKSVSDNTVSNWISNPLISFCFRVVFLDFWPLLSCVTSKTNRTSEKHLGSGLPSIEIYWLNPENETTTFEQAQRRQRHPNRRNRLNRPTQVTDYYISRPLCQ